VRFLESSPKELHPLVFHLIRVEFRIDVFLAQVFQKRDNFALFESFRQFDAILLHSVVDLGGIAATLGDVVLEEGSLVLVAELS